MCGGHWAVAGEVLGILFINFADNGFGDFDRFVVSLCFDCIGAVVSGAALNCVNVCVGDQVENIAGF